MRSLRLRPDPIVLKTVFFPITLGTGITLNHSQCSCPPTASPVLLELAATCALGWLKPFRQLQGAEKCRSESLLSLTSENEVVLSISLWGEGLFLQCK